MITNNDYNIAKNIKTIGDFLNLGTKRKAVVLYLVGAIMAFRKGQVVTPPPVILPDEIVGFAGGVNPADYGITIIEFAAMAKYMREQHGFAPVVAKKQKTKN